MPFSMRISIAVSVAVIAACVFLDACAQKQSPDELRRETAQATSTVKQDATAVAEGVRDGLKGNKPLDLNTCSRGELLELPGVTRERADRIIAARPFGSTDELVNRHILSQAEYDRVRDRIRVGK